MLLEKVCGPVLLYLGFSLIQIIIDIFKNLYNTAFLKFVVMIIFAFILNLLCSLNLNVISWLLVFIPFISMTFLVSVLLIVFGLNPTKGQRKKILPGVPTPSHFKCHKNLDEYECLTNNKCMWDFFGGRDNLGKCISIKRAEESSHIIDPRSAPAAHPGSAPAAHHSKHKSHSKKHCPKGCIAPQEVSGNCKTINKHGKLVKECGWECGNLNKDCKYDTDCKHCLPLSHFPLEHKDRKHKSANINPVHKIQFENEKCHYSCIKDHLEGNKILSSSENINNICQEHCKNHSKDPKNPIQ